LNDKTEKKEMVVLDKARLPYNTRLNDKFGIDLTAWQTLCNVTFPSAKSAEIVISALRYCQARKLDVFKRPVHIVPMWSSLEKAMVETIWPGISELRTTAFRTNQFAGMGPTEWGPDITKVFTGKVDKGYGSKKEQVDVEVELTFPEWCRIDAYRVVNGERVLWAGPTVYWEETYAKQGRTNLPNAMWQQRPRGQLEKCSEAATLRRVFPEEIGSDYSMEEMEGQVYAGTGPIIEHETAGPKPSAEEGKTQPLDAYEIGRLARDSGDEAPDGMDSADYRKWKEGWNHRDAELSKQEEERREKQGEQQATEESNQADEKEPQSTEQPSLDMGGDDALTDYELEIRDALAAALDSAEVEDIEAKYHKAGAGQVKHPELVEDWINEKRETLKKVKS
jgi:phage recombination protein Bet